MLLKSAAFASQAAACDGDVSPATRVRGSLPGTYTVPAQDLSRSQHSPFQRVYHADPEKRTKPPKSSLLRATEGHVQLFSVRNWSEDSRKCFSDRVHSEMSYILILPQHDSGSWTDLTFLLKPAIRPGHFLPSWHYFQYQRHGAPAPVAGAAEGNLYKPSFVPMAQAGCPSCGRGAGVSVQRGLLGLRGQAASGGNNSWHLLGTPWGSSPGQQLATAPGGAAKNSSPVLLILGQRIPGEEEEVLGRTANLVCHVGMQM